MGAIRKELGFRTVFNILGTITNPASPSIQLVITPEDFGLKTCKKEDLVGGTPEENAKITRAILHGEKGPKRDAVLMNAVIELEEAYHFYKNDPEFNRALAGGNHNGPCV